MKIYQIKRFTGKFPQRLAKDPVIRSSDNLKSAQLISIKLNEGENRYYVQEIETGI